jgi:hypothetical protein
LFAVRSNIIRAALLVSKYRLTNGLYAKIDVGFSRGSVHSRIEFIKNLFPYEDIFLAEFEIDEKELAMQMLFPHFDTY